MKNKLIFTGLIISMLGIRKTLGQGILISEERSMHQILEELYSQMMPLCSGLISVAQGLAGLATLCYISSRVWQHILRAEAIDLYPLFRPFVLGFCISVFPLVLTLINGVMQPTVWVTGQMVGNSNQAVELLLEQKRIALEKTEGWQMYIGESGQGDRDQWYRYTYQDAEPSGEGTFEGIGNDIKFNMSKASYNFRQSIKEWLSEVLTLLFEAAALCIDTLRTFQMIVLSILGPLVFGLSVFDAFRSSYVNWLNRYITVFLWLPVANLFGSIIGKVQENMLKIDISQLQDKGETFFSRTDATYLIFLLIGIVGYFTVPTVAGYIVSSTTSTGGFVQQVNSMLQSSSRNIFSSMKVAGGAIYATGERLMGQFRKSDSSTSQQDFKRDRFKGNS